MGAPRVTLKDFITRANILHSNKYTYSQVVWNGTQSFVKIKCPEHGIFEQRANAHLLGKGCKRCACVATNAALRKGVKEILTTLKSLHPKLKFPNPHNVYTRQMEFDCKIHGANSMKLGSLLRGQTCKKCSVERNTKKMSFTREEFIERAREVHGDAYDYSKVNYKTMHVPITIVCPTHGKFLMKPQNHIVGQRCKECARCSFKTRVKGKVFKVESRAEERALQLLMKHTTIKAKEVFDRHSGEVPIFYGNFGRFKRYLPDFYAPTRNLIIEVKGANTFGISGHDFFYDKPETLIRRMQARAKVVMEDGYRFMLIVVVKDERLKLPSGWINMNPKELIALFSESAHALCK